jgi:hypothetical protein
MSPPLLPAKYDLNTGLRRSYLGYAHWNLFIYFKLKQGMLRILFFRQGGLRFEGIDSFYRSVYTGEVDNSLLEIQSLLEKKRDSGSRQQIGEFNRTSGRNLGENQKRTSMVLIFAKGHVARLSSRCRHISASTFASLAAPSRPLSMATKPNTTPVPVLVHGVDVYKDKEKNPPPVALERSEYPYWVSSLTPGGLPSLAALKRMDVEDATDREKRRYLKLTSRAKIRSQNADAADSG